MQLRLLTHLHHDAPCFNPPMHISTLAHTHTHTLEDDQAQEEDHVERAAQEGKHDRAKVGPRPVALPVGLCVCVCVCEGGDGPVSQPASDSA